MVRNCSFLHVFKKIILCMPNQKFRFFHQFFLESFTMNLGTNKRVQSEVALSGTVFQKQLKRDNGMFSRCGTVVSDNIDYEKFRKKLLCR